jgi:hypothetical protein
MYEIERIDTYFVKVRATMNSLDLSAAAGFYRSSKIKRKEMNSNSSLHVSTPEQKLSFFKEALIDIYNVRNALQKQSSQKRPSVLNEVDNFSNHAIFYQIFESSVTLLQFEKELCDTFHVRNLNLSISLSNALNVTLKQCVKWKCQVCCNDKDPLDTNYTIKFLPPDITSSSGLYSYCLGDDRFLFVTVLGIFIPNRHLEATLEGNVNELLKNQRAYEHWSQMKLFQNGIMFGGRQYYFLGGEDTEKLSIYKQLSSDEVSKRMKGITAWFFNEQPPFSPSTPLSILQIRDYLGHLSVEKPGKANARLKLGFSNVYPIEIDEDNVNIQMIPDIPTTPPDPKEKKVMTDGCGLISLSLLRSFSLPYGISSGIPHSSRGSLMPTPIMIQIRCICRIGLFKGCLFVTNDEELCPKNTIFFRKSMKKASLSPYYSDLSIHHQKSILGIAKTFEKPSLLLSFSLRKSMKSDYSIKLNQISCLLLHYLKIPYEYFEDLMKCELYSLMNCLSSENDARKLIKQIIKMTKSQQRLDKEDDDDKEDGEEGGEEEGVGEGEELDIDDLSELDQTILMDDEYDDNKGLDDELDDDNAFFETMQFNQNLSNDFYNNVMNNKNDSFSSVTSSFHYSEQLRYMLLSGMKLTESYVSKLFYQLISYRIDYLQKCRLTLPNSLYLVGAPDPYGILEPNEVFISFPNDRKEMASTLFLNCKTLRSSSSSSSSSSSATQVLVTRHPLVHPGDLRLFTVRSSYPEIEEKSIQFSNGGVILFSTKGTRMIADMMSGGDYDGDLFLVCYNDDNGFLDHFQTVPPYVEEEDEEQEEKREKSQETALSSSQHFCQSLHCRLCADRQGVSMLRSLLLATQRQSVGIYSKAWQKYADLNPLSAETMECAKITRIALDAAKTGKVVPENHRLLSKAPKLHWMVDETIRTYGKKTTRGGGSWNPSSLNFNTLSLNQAEDRRNNSAIGTRKIESFDENDFILSEEDYILSPDFLDNNERYNSFPSSQQQNTNRSSRLSSMRTSSSVKSTVLHSHSVVGKLYDFTNHVLKEFNQTFLQRLLQQQQKRNNSSNLTSSQRLSSASSSIMPDVQFFLDFDCIIVLELDFNEQYRSQFPELSLSFQQLTTFCSSTEKSFRLYSIDEFKENLYFQFPLWKHLFEIFYSKIIEYKSSLAIILSEKSLNRFERNSKINSLKFSHYQYFLSMVDQYSMNYPTITKKLLQLRIAGILYFSTYLLAKSSEVGYNSTGSVSLLSSIQTISGISYCWELCFKELLYNKNQMNLKRKRDSLYDLISPKELNYWF